MRANDTRTRMRPASRPGAAMAAASALLLMLAACGTPAGVGATTRPAAGGSSTPGVASGTSCDELLAAIDPAPALGDGLVDAGVTGLGVGDYYGLATLAMGMQGGLSCFWENTAASTSLRLVVLPGAAETWAGLASEVAVFQPHAGRFGPDSFHGCIGSGCTADALLGDRWASVFVGGASDEETAWALVERVLAAVTAVEIAAPPAPVGAPHACASLLPDAVQGELFGGALALDTAFAPTQPVVLHGALVQAGGTHCYWRGVVGGVGASVRIGLVPGGASGWNAHWATDPVGASPIEWQADPALGDEARAGCFQIGSGSCFVAVRAADDALSVDVVDESGAASATAIAIATEVLGAVG